jgi:hypothetical protein
MGTIIGAYHEPSPRFIPALPVLQEWASKRGIAGTDLEWCWINLNRLKLPGQGDLLTDWAYDCPLCGHYFVVQDVDGNLLPLHPPYWLGLCGGCGVVWWF